jgi:hypothetical protein
MRTFSPDSNYGPWWGRRLGCDLALMGLVKLSQPTSSIFRDLSEGRTSLRDYSQESTCAKGSGTGTVT